MIKPVLFTFALLVSCLARTCPAQSAPAVDPSRTSPATVATASTVAAASTAATTGTVAPAGKFAGEPMVIEHLSTVYRMHADGTGSKTIHAVVRLQSEAAARQFSVLAFGYASSNESVEMRSLAVRKPDGSVIATPAADAQDQPAEVTRLAPFYSDLRQKQYPVRSLSAGDTLEYELVTQITKAQAINAQAQAEFWGAEALSQPVVTLDESIELRLPRERKVLVVSPKQKPQVTDEGAEQVYRWQTSQLKPTVALPGAPKDDTTAAEADPNHGLPEIAWTTFKDWAAVGEWYRSLAADRAAATPELRAKAATLTAGATTDEEKVRRIYTYVSANIRYIGVAFRIGRYQPHPAGEVQANQYGDCKDKHTLLAALLSAAGFTAEPVLIGDGVKFDQAVPAPFSFNHVITAVELNGRRVWLDSTAEVAPYGVLSATLRDKDGLLMPGTGAPVLVKTPATLPFAAFDHWEATGSLDKEGKLTGHFDVTLRGDTELPLRWALRQTTAAQWQQLGQGLSNNFGFSGTVSNFVPGPAEKTDEPLHYSYDYERPTYGDWPTHRIVSLVPGAFFTMPTIEKKPAEPIELGNPRLETARSVIKLPEGFSVTLPEASHVASGFAKYDVTYALKDGAVICETKLEVLAGSVPATQWEEYRSFAKQVEDHSGLYVQLRAPGEASPEGETASKADTAAGGAENDVSDVRVEALLQDSWNLAKVRKLPEAEAKLAEARKLNPDERGEWAMAAVLAQLEQRPAEAEADLQKEIALHPTNDTALRALALFAMGQKKRPLAIEALQKLLKLKPGDTSTTVQLASLYMAEKRYPEALTLLQAAAFKAPDNKLLILRLGTTQLAAGRTEEAIATLHTAIENATDPLVLNDAAYQLAEHHADLPLAETSARKALALLDARSQKFTLARVTQPDLDQTGLIAATWDTLGWIEYAKGDAKAAEPYIAAAWATMQRSEEGYHLGQVYEKLGRREEAYRVYRRATAAMAQEATFDGSGDMALRIAALEKDGVHPTGRVVDDRGALSEERTYTLPLLEKNQLSGDFYLLLSPGKVQGASWAEGAPQLKALETKLPAVLEPALAGREKPGLFPSRSSTQLLRRAVLSCSPLLHSCMLALLLPQDAHVTSITAADATASASANQSE